MEDRITAISDRVLCQQSNRSVRSHLLAILTVAAIGTVVASFPGVYTMIVDHMRKERRDMISHEYLVQSRELINEGRVSDALNFATMATKISPNSRACRVNLLRVRQEAR